MLSIRHDLERELLFFGAHRVPVSWRLDAVFKAIHSWWREFQVRAVPPREPATPALPLEPEVRLLAQGGNRSVAAGRRRGPAARYQAWQDRE